MSVQKPREMTAAGRQAPVKTDQSDGISVQRVAGEEDRRFVLDRGVKGSEDQDSAREQGQTGRVRRRSASRLSSLFGSELWRYLISAEKEDRELFTLSLTYPEGIDPAYQCVSAHEFFTGIAVGAGEGAWLVGELHGRLHWYGIALTPRQNEIIRLWCSLTGGSPRAQKLGRVTGQGKPWSDSNASLRCNLVRIIDYPILKYPSDEAVLRRVVVSGSLRPLWAKACSRLPTGSPNIFPAYEASPRIANASTCLHCSRPIPRGKRRDARYCSASCRQGGYRRRKDEQSGS